MGKVLLLEFFHARLWSGARTKADHPPYSHRPSHSFCWDPFQALSVSPGMLPVANGIARLFGTWGPYIFDTSRVSKLFVCISHILYFLQGAQGGVRVSSQQICEGGEAER